MEAIPGNNTAEGTKRSFKPHYRRHYNTAIGWLSLRSDTTGQFNTAVGAGTLLCEYRRRKLRPLGPLRFSVILLAQLNTATGAFALFSNTTGQDNTANGASALQGNTTGHDNTANGR